MIFGVIFMNNLKKIFFLILCFFVFSNVKAYSTENCTGFNSYVDYSDVYQLIYNDSSYRQFYVDFKDWYNNQSTYNDYLILRQYNSNDSYINRIYLFTDVSQVPISLHHKTTNYSNYFAIFPFFSLSRRVDVGYFEFNSSIFDSSSLTSCNLMQSNNGCALDTNYFTYFNGTYSSFNNIDNLTAQKSFTWVEDTNNNLYRGSFIIIDSSFDIPLKGYTGGNESFIPYKVNDNYYCFDDIVPTLESIYPLETSPTPTPTNEDLIYLPINDFTSYDTYIYLDKNTIRAIKDNTCTDFDLSNHYNKIISSCENFDSSNYVIIEQQNLTNDFLYRLDISSFIILLFFMFIIVVFIPYYVFSSFFRKRRF